MGVNLIQTGIFWRIATDGRVSGQRIKSPPFLARSYLIEEGQKVVATVCLLIGDNQTILARGISTCSPGDNYSKRTGRNKSFGRAIKAMVQGAKGRNNEDSGEPIRFSLHRPYNHALLNMGFQYKSEQYPIIVRAEERVIVAKTKQVFERFRSQLEESNK